MEQNTILKEEILRISEIMGIKPNLINEQWWKSLARTVLGGTDLSDFLSHATGKLGKSITKLDDITKPSEWFKVLKKTPGKFRTLKDALLDSINGELATKGIVHNPASWVKKTNEEILQDLQKVGVTGDNALEYVKMFQSKHGVRAKKVSTSTGSVTPPVETLPPTGGRKISNVDADVDISKKSYTEVAEQVAKKYGKENIQEFVDKLDAIGMEEKTKKLFLLDYKKYHDWSIPEMAAEKQSIMKQMTKPQKETYNTILSYLKYATPKNIGIATLSILSIMLGYWVIKNVNKLTGTSEDVKKLNPFKEEENKKEDKKEEDKVEQPAPCPPGVNC